MLVLLPSDVSTFLHVSSISSLKQKFARQRMPQERGSSQLINLN